MLGESSLPNKPGAMNQLKKAMLTPNIAIYIVRLKDADSALVNRQDTTRFQQAFTPVLTAAKDILDAIEFLKRETKVSKAPVEAKKAISSK